MKKTITKVGIAAGLTAVLIAGGTVSANASTHYVGGGAWQYGVGQIWNYSDYYHPYYYHRSTAHNAKGAFHRNYNEAGRWSEARLPAQGSGNRASWYHNYGARNF